MDLLKDFNHFIAYFVPGIAMTFAVMLGLSVLFHVDVLNLFLSFSRYYWGIILLTIAVSATICGIFLDEIKHIFIEDFFWNLWHFIHNRSNKISKEHDLEYYIPIVGQEIYDLLINENFYFHEFECNISLALLMGGLLLPTYLSYFYKGLDKSAVVISQRTLFAIGFTFLFFSYKAFAVLLSNFFDILDRKRKTKQRAKSS